MKTKEELAALKKEVKELNAKIAELSEEELEQVTGAGEITNDEVNALLKIQSKTDQMYQLFIGYNKVK